MLDFITHKKSIFSKVSIVFFLTMFFLSFLTNFHVPQASAYVDNYNLGVSLDYQGMSQSSFGSATINTTITYQPSNQDLYHTITFAPIISKYAPTSPGYDFGWANDVDLLMNPISRYVGNLNPITITFFYHPLITQGWNYLGCVAQDDTPYSSITFCNNSASVNYTGSVLPVYRFWNSRTQDHFYTYDHDEKISIDNYPASSAWNYEEMAYHAFWFNGASCDLGSPVYRFWSQNTQQHFYTIDPNEANFIKSHYAQADWAYEGVSYCQPMYTNNTCGSYLPVYRYWNSSAKVHFFTTSSVERNQLASSPAWQNEGIAFCALP